MKSSESLSNVAEKLAAAILEEGLVDLGPISEGRHPGAVLDALLADAQFRSLLVAHVQVHADELADTEEAARLARNLAGPNGEGFASRNF